MVKKLTKKIQKIKLFQTKITTLFFAFLGAFTLSFIGYFLYFQISEAKDVDEILPAENVMIVTEFSSVELAKFIEENEDFRTHIIDPFLKQYLNKNLTDFASQAKGWLGNKAAFAIYNGAEENEEESYYLFLENNNQRKALEFLRSLGVQGEELKIEKYKKFEILSFSQSLNVDCSFLYGYLICSNESAALKKLIDLNQAQSVFLHDLGDYNRVKNNLPKIGGGRVYFNLQKIDFSQYEIYLGPLKEYLKEGGLSFTRINQGLRLNSYLSLKKGLVATGSVVTKNDLDKYVYADDLGFYLGGTNLKESFKQILKVWDEATPYFAIILEGMLRARVANYFGTEVSLEEDIYELLKNAYAFEVRFLPMPQFKLILEIDDEEEADQILQKMLEGFYLQSEEHKVEKKETTLKDGSVVRELLANDDKVKKVKTDFEGSIIQSVEIENVPFSFAYAIKDKKVFLGTSVAAVQENLNLAKHSGDSLFKNEIYKEAKNNMFLEGEESSYFNLNKVSAFLTLLGIDTQEVNFLATFSHAVFSTKWFDDGMAGEAILLR